MWVKRWVDDGEEIAVSDDGLSRVVVRSDSYGDMDWDDEYSPALVAVDSRGRISPAYAWGTWHAGQESDDLSDHLARAVEYYRTWYRAIRGNADTCIERYMRLYHGATAVHRVSTHDSKYYVSDGTELRALWRTSPSYSFASDHIESLTAWLHGEVHSAHLQTRASDSDYWEDSGESLFGLYGYDYACETARELLG